MRPIHLNLAAQPYRDYRPVYLVVTVLALAMAALMLNNADAAYRYYVNTTQTREKISSLEAEATEERTLNQKIESQLRNVNVKSLSAQTTYINARIAERTFSWSQLLDQLEKVLPNDVRLVSLNPSVDTRTGATRVQISLEGKSQGALIKTLQRLQSTPYFYRPFPLSQSISPSGLTMFRIETGYNPAPRGLTE